MADPERTSHHSEKRWHFLPRDIGVRITHQDPDFVAAQIINISSPADLDAALDWIVEKSAELGEEAVDLALRIGKLEKPEMSEEGEMKVRKQLGIK